MLEGAGFQFHKGTIRTNTQQGQVHQLGYFNSIKVQLEPKGSVAFNEYKEFQFHKGTIRTRWQPDKAVSQTIFQFHKGTIRTPCF